MAGSLFIVPMRNKMYELLVLPYPPHEYRRLLQSRSSRNFLQLDRRVALNPNDPVTRVVLNGVVDYGKNPDAFSTVRLEEIDKETDYYLGYNRKAGMNSDTSEDMDTLTKSRAIQTISTTHQIGLAVNTIRMMSTNCQQGHSCSEVPTDIEKAFSRVEGQATQWTARPWNSSGRSAYHRTSQAIRIFEKTFSWEVSLHNMESLSAMLQIDSKAQGMDWPPPSLTSRLLSSFPARVPPNVWWWWRRMDMGWVTISKPFPRKCPLFIHLKRYKEKTRGSVPELICRYHAVLYDLC